MIFLSCLLTGPSKCIPVKPIEEYILNDSNALVIWNGELATERDRLRDFRLQQTMH